MYVELDVYDRLCIKLHNFSQIKPLIKSTIKMDKYIIHKSKKIR